MIKSLKSNKILTAILVAILTASMLFAGVTLLAPKTTEVKAAGTSTTLKGFNLNSDGSYNGSPWFGRLGTTGVTMGNIVSITITTTPSKIQGFTKGNDVSHVQDGLLYYYYKLSGTKVDDVDNGIYNTDGYDIVIYADVDTIYAPTCSYSLFNNLDNCKTITFDNFDTSNVTEMVGMFSLCTSLTSLDLSSFNTSNVTDMHTMFYECSSLTSLNLSNFNTSNVTDMGWMFLRCSSLTSIKVAYI